MSLSSNNSDENNSSSKDFNTSNINENEKMEGNKNTTKKLYDIINNEHFKIPYLSMGMSNDYKIAINEGSTMIRVGSKVFKWA